jgi:hypothetical protein
MDRYKCNLRLAQWSQNDVNASIKQYFNQIQEQSVYFYGVKAFNMFTGNWIYRIDFFTHDKGRHMIIFPKTEIQAKNTMAYLEKIGCFKTDEILKDPHYELL